MARRGRRNRKGFSGGLHGIWFKLLTGAMGMRGRQKRAFLNQLALLLVISVGIAAGTAGLIGSGFSGMLIWLGVGTVIATNWMVKGRFFR